MPYLTVTNGYESILPGVGIKKSFAELSKKRITKAVREHLRNRYDNIKVSCEANYNNGIWKGVCWIDNEKYNYQLRE